MESKLKDTRVAELMENIGLNVYSFERDRKRDIETRAGVFLAIIGVIVGIILTNFKVELMSLATSKIEICFVVIIYILQLISLIFILVSFSCFVKVLQTGGYKTLELPKLIKKEFLNDNFEEFTFDVADSLKNIVEKNKLANNKKVEFFENAITYLVRSVYVYIPAFIGYLILNQLIK